jgi:hypothetical protein
MFSTYLIVGPTGNLTTGGDGVCGIVVSDSTKAKLSEFQKKRFDVSEPVGIAERNKKKFQCPKGHLLVEPNLIKRKNDAQRNCLTCHRDRERARRTPCE